MEPQTQFTPRERDPAAPTFLMGYDSTPIQAEKSLYDLAEWAKGKAELAAWIMETPTDEIARSLLEGKASWHKVEGWDEFASCFRAYLRQYGHIIYELDFGKPLPLDTPEPMLETCKRYLRDEGVNPHERQKGLETRRIQAAEATLKRLKGLNLWAFRKSLDFAQSLASVRERALADIGLGYPALRRMLRELGRRFVAAGAIVRPDDIYWLEKDEIDKGVAALESRDRDMSRWQPWRSASNSAKQTGRRSNN